MFFSVQTLAALAAFAPMVSAHIRMIGPASVYAHIAGKEQDPLNGDGSNYPCFYTDGGSGAKVEWSAGTTQQIELQGSAVHGGGSCQISIAYPNGNLNANTEFKVLKSFEGACPPGSTTGNLPENIELRLPGLSFNLPKGLPSGDAVIAWSWFNKIGNREMYMRCAPVKVTGGANDKTLFSQLPDMFKANINNGCTVPEGGDLIFPNPGANKVGSGSIQPQGAGCQKAGANPLPNLPVPVPTTTKPILVGVPTTTPVPSAPAPPAVTTTLVVVPQKPTSTTVPVAAPTVTPVPPKNAPKPSPPVGGACVDGQIVCTSATTWAMCNFGTPIPMGNTAAGLECQDGKMVLAKRTVRFSDAHRRRHHSN
jgi:hypothetical protein